jgi:hypothetical protein
MVSFHAAGSLMIGGMGELRVAGAARDVESTAPSDVDPQRIDRSNSARRDRKGRPKEEEPMTETVLVNTRGAAVSMPSLAMRCDPKEIPEAADGTKPTGWWLVDDCTFGGQIQSAADDGTVSESETVVVKSMAAVAVFDERVIGIARPASQESAALWWSWSLTSTTVSGVGVQGLFKKRPSAIRLDRNGGVDDNDGDTIVLKHIARLYRNNGSFQAGQEGSLLEALVS